MFCESCGGKLETSAKFCAGCGTAAPKKQTSGASHLTTSEVIDFLSSEGEVEDDGLFSVFVPIGKNDDRAQLVFITVVEDDSGETDFDHLVFWSPFASTRQVSLKKAFVAVADRKGFGMSLANGLYGIKTMAYVEDFATKDGLLKLCLSVAHVADQVEDFLLGTDEY